jgi:hypothetical protein
MRKILRHGLSLLALVLLLVAIAPLSYAATDSAVVVAACGTPPTTYTAGHPFSITQDTTGKSCVNAAVSVSASITGFTPNGSAAALSVTTSSGNVALPSGTAIAVTNTGSADASIKLSVGAGSAATTDWVLKAGATAGLTPGANTFINAITATGSTTLSIAGGSGLVTGFGGSSSGGASSTVAISQTGTDNNVKTVSGSTTAVTQATAANLNATVVGTGTFATQSTIAGPLGQDVSANSVPVVIASDQSAVPVSGSVTIASGSVDQGAPNTPGNAWPTTPVDSGGTSMTNTSDHSMNVRVTNNGVAAGTTTAGATYAGVAGASSTACNARSDTNAQINPVNLDLKGNLCVDAIGSAGTAGTASAQVFSVQGVASMTPVTVAGATSAGDTTTAAKYVNIATTAATNCSTAAYTNAQLDPPQVDLIGNLCVKTSPQVGSMVTGRGTQTGTTTTSLVSAVTSKVLYITAYSCSNTGASASDVLFQDGSGGTTLWDAIVPAGGGNNLASSTPMFKTTSGNALFFAPQTSSTTVSCNASGFSQ